MVVSTERGRDAYTPDPTTPKGGLSMQPQLTISPTFGDPRLPARFWAKVKLGSAPTHRPDLGPCWEWTGARCGREGEYGQFSLSGRNHSAHRVAFTALVGDIPLPLTIDHLCRVGLCVNVGHLEVVSGRINVLRGLGPTARNARKTHCLRGHPFVPSNTKIKKGGYRNCRTCNLNSLAASRGHIARKRYF
jgi:hypothetical protein